MKQDYTYSLSRRLHILRSRLDTSREELTTTYFVEKNNDHHLYITCYITKRAKFTNTKDVGIDPRALGVKRHLPTKLSYSTLC